LGQFLENLEINFFNPTPPPTLPIPESKVLVFLFFHCDNNNQGRRNGCNLKHITSEREDEIVPLTEKEFENLTIQALKDELAKRNLSNLNTLLVMRRSAQMKC